jgi:alpha-D-xyloside xylohydrolase
MNYKFKNEELFQYNTKVSLPIIVLTKGYGILWHNYSSTRFGNHEAYQNLCDVFKLFDKNGIEGYLTTTYNISQSYSEIRNETSINYEGIKLIKIYPTNFPKPESSAKYEFSIEPNETDTYLSKLHYAGYVKVFVDEQEVIKERWRAAWNPNDVKFSFLLEKGKKYSFLNEWLPDVDISYLRLKVFRSTTFDISVRVKLAIQLITIL